MAKNERNRRSAMFFPALEAHRIEEALAVGADIAVFDLEDNTADAMKDEARLAVQAIFEVPLDRPILRYLRINHPASPVGLRDMAALLDWTCPPDGIIIPKVESAAELAWVHATVGHVHKNMELMPIIETPAGLESAHAIAAAPGVTVVLLGCDDMSGELGSDYSWDGLVYARGRIAAATAAAGVEAMDGPWRDADDEAGLIAETARVAAMGFSGKASYHADQVFHIHAAFTPTPEAVAEALGIVEAGVNGLSHLDGRIVNAAVVRSVRRLLAIAERRSMG